MPNENNPQWLEDYAAQAVEQQERKTNLEREISEQFRDQLSEQNLNFQVNDNPLPITNVDPFSPFSHHRLVEEILDIYKFIPPYIQQATFLTIALGHATNATKAVFFSAPRWNAPNYATRAAVDKNSGKMTAIGHVDKWTGGDANYSRTLLEYTTIPMDKDYTSLAILLNYFFDYKLEYILNPASNQFLHSQQEVTLTVTVKEFTPSGVETGRAGIPSSELLYGYKHLYQSPNPPMTFSSQQKPKQYWKRIQVPNAKTGHYYKVIVELYVYTWMGEGKGAAEANFVVLPPM